MVSEDKMDIRTRFAILALMWLLTIALALAAVNTNASLPFVTTAAVYRPSQPGPASQVNFKTMTVAVCDKTDAGSIRCHDEVKVICGDDEYLLPKSASQASCGSLKLDIPPITSFEVFDKDWKDPRYS